MLSIRSKVVELLANSLSEKTAKAYENEIYKLCVNTWDGDADNSNEKFLEHLSRISYEKLEMLLSADGKEGRKKVVADIKKGVFGWNSDHFKNARDDLSFKIQRESKPMEVAEGIFKCRRCGGSKTTSVAAQLRGADEPMTNFVTCVSCKNRWKC